MNHYLIVWGSAADQIRVGVGENETVAARYAFGMTAANMTCLQVSRYELQTDSRRTRRCHQLLGNHIERMRMLNSDDSTCAITEAIKMRADLERHWLTRWARLREKTR